MPWTNRKAVAFTECPWGALLDHAERYSPYGIGFNKARLFAAGGGPAIYMRPDLYERQREAYICKDHPDWRGFDSNIHAFITPFVPRYAPSEYISQHSHGRSHIDYSHEREWRVPHNFSFGYDHIQFVIVNSYEDVAQFERELKDAIGRDKFLIMDVYRQIERLWPTHIIARGRGESPSE